MSDQQSTATARMALAGLRNAIDDGLEPWQVRLMHQAIAEHHVPLEVIVREWQRALETKLAALDHGRQRGIGQEGPNDERDFGISY